MTSFDDCNRVCFVYFLENKSDVTEKFKEYMQMVQSFHQHNAESLESGW